MKDNEAPQRVEPAMSAAPVRAFVCLVAAAPLAPAPALASPYTDAVETAVFSLCPQLRSGRIVADDPSALAALGYFRAPEVEDDMTDAEDGAPIVFRRGRGLAAITVAYWPSPQLCSVRFAGRQAAAAAERVRARVTATPQTYRPEPAAGYVLGDVRHEAWRVAGRRSACLAIDGPTAESGTTTYNVNLEPLSPLHPAVSLSACAPADAGR